MHTLLILSRLVVCIAITLYVMTSCAWVGSGSIPFDAASCISHPPCAVAFPAQLVTPAPDASQPTDDADDQEMATPAPDVPKPTDKASPVGADVGDQGKAVPALDALKPTEDARSDEVDASDQEKLTPAPDAPLPTDDVDDQEKATPAVS